MLVEEGHHRESLDIVEFIRCLVASETEVVGELSCVLLGVLRVKEMVIQHLLYQRGYQIIIKEYKFIGGKARLKIAK